MDNDQLSFAAMEEYVIVCKPNNTEDKYYYSNELQHGTHWTTSIQDAVRIPGARKDKFARLIHDLTEATNTDIASYMILQDQFKQKRDDIYKKYYDVWKKDPNADPQKYADMLDDLNPALNRQTSKLEYLPPYKAGQTPSPVTVSLEQI